MQGRTVFARLVHPHGLWKLKPRNSPKRDVEGAVPYNCAMACRAAKSLSLFADLHCAMGEKQSGAEFLLRHRFVLFFTFICFFAFFCTACRLSPIEALLQALTGLCPVPFARFARF